MKHIVIHMSEEEYELAYRLMAASIKNLVKQAGDGIGRQGALFAIRNSFVLLSSVMTRSLRDGGIDLEDAISMLKDAIDGIAEIDERDIVTAIYEQKDFLDTCGSSENIF